MHLLVLFGAVSAWAGDDYASEAEKMMKLHYGLDEVEETIAAPARAPAAAPAPPPEAYDYGDDAYRPRPPPPPVAALPLEPNSDVDQVVVFRDRALVTRTMSREVEAGASSVEFEGLPLGLAADSLEGTIRGGSARIVGVELVSGTGNVEETERIAEVREEAKDVAQQLGEVRDHIESLLAQRAYLRGALVPSGDHPAPGVDQVKQTIAYVGASEQDIAARLRKEQDTAQELDKKLQPLMTKLADPLATGMTVRVDLDAPAKGKVTLGLRYQVTGAAWWPTYNARLDEKTNRVTLEYYGIVAQSTGEAWKGAKLLLSTADPATSGQLPVLSTWFLDANGYVGSSLSAGGGYSTTPDNVQMAQQAIPSGAVQSTLDAQVQGGGAVVFAIDGARTVAGDGSEQRLPIGTQTFDAVLELASTPKVVPEVFRRARVRYDGQMPMLPGAVSSFVGGDFVGTGDVDAIVPGEELRLAFGTDDHLKVDRQLLARNEDFFGPGKSKVRYTFHYRIKVRNFGPDAREVTVTDQVPVSQSDRVTVETSGTPSLPSAPDDPPGILRWKVNVPASGEQTIDLTFTVTAPKDQAQAIQRYYEDAY